MTSVEAIEAYIVALIAATRRPAEFGDKLKDWITIGASPRGSLALDRCSRDARLAARPRPCRCRPTCRRSRTIACAIA